MEFDIEGFYILEQGFQEDLKKRENFHKSQIQTDFFLREQEMRSKHDKARLQARKSERLAHMRAQAMKATEHVIKRKEDRFEEEKKKALSERLKPDLELLEQRVYGGVGMREKQVQLAKEHKRKQAEQASQQSREEFNKKRLDKEVELKKKDQLEKDFNKQANQKKQFVEKKTSIERKAVDQKTNQENAEAFRARILQGREAQKVVRQNSNDNTKNRDI